MHDVVCGEMLNCTLVFRYMVPFETEVNINNAIETTLKPGLIGVLFVGWQPFRGCFKVL
jgi:hypothetical protein